MENEAEEHWGGIMDLVVSRHRSWIQYKNVNIDRTILYFHKIFYKVKVSVRPAMES